MECELVALGVVSALGNGTEETERRLFAGDTSGMVPLDGLTQGDGTVFGAVPLADAEVAAAGTRVGALVDRAMAQLAPALDEIRREKPDAVIGAVIGTSNSTMEEFTDSPDRIDMAYPAERLRSRWGVNGPAWCVSTACSSSAKAFASARRLLENGICDAVVVGGADARTRTVAEGFHALEALSPALTRPLAADRDGINLGEGAALFVMREARRFDRPQVCLLGVGESSDAHHLTAPDPEGKGAEAAMRAALADAGLEPGGIDYVNLHGTGTTYNDAMECAAVRRVFGDATPCSSTKPLTGHCLGAAGAVEAAICWLALRRGKGLPPHVTAAVDATLAPFPVPRVGDGRTVRTALSNSFAFGGSNASVVLGRLAPLDELLPQARPMILLSGYRRSRAMETAEAYVDVAENSPFYDHGERGVPGCVALEYMAQTMALCVGEMRRRKGLKPQVGFVLGSRRLDVRIARFVPGERYAVTATCTYEDESFGSFDCSIVNSLGETVAAAMVTAYQLSSNG